jgi:hypothetical protein
MHHVLFVRDRSSNASLAEVAARVFSLLPVGETEERESSNYVDGHYFIGYAANGSVEVCHSDGAELEEEYPYWVVLQDRFTRKGAQGVLNTSPEVVAAALADGGFKVFVPSDGWGKVDWVPSGKTYGA